MASPPLSILMPARNAQAFVGEALESLLGQTFGDFELMAVDDASTDGTGSLLADAARRDRRVRVVKGPGRGICAALNAGLELCRAPLVARMDADDVALPQRLACQVAELERRPELAGVGSRVEIFPRKELTEGLKAYESWLNAIESPADVRRERFIESPLVHPATVVRAAVLREVGGWHDDGWPEDYALWLELIARGYPLANLPEVLLRWRDGPQRLTRTSPAYSPAAILRLKAHYLARGPLAAGRCIVWGAGKTGRALIRALAVEGMGVELLVDVDPAKIGHPLQGVDVVAPQSLGGFNGVHLVAAVGTRGARALIREHLAGKGWLEGDQFTCIA
ncbi:MAG: glycosyltransferase [Deltaproteobacteria bacterium]|nr:glycosyltransferase [Deltaproteobacteria bacterium]